MPKHINPNEVAEKFWNGGNVTTQEARVLAGDYLNLRNIVQRQEREIEALKGGEVVTDYHEVKERKWRVWTPNGVTASTESALNDELGPPLVKRIPDIRVLRQGSRAHLDRFYRINELITKLAQECYDAGLKKGKSLLLGLAEGSLSVKDFNDKVGNS